jgi:anaerobic magnesium-protoporphyrin IX monomethyl ester cyclase
MTLRVGYVQPCSIHDVQWFEPLAPGYLASWLKREHGGQVRFQMITGPDDVTGLDVLAISATSQDFGHAVNVARMARQRVPRIITVLGGHHPTMLPDTVGHEFDVLVLGEGEETFGELIGAIMRAGRLPDEGRLAQISGIGFPDMGKVFLSDRRQLIDPLDRIPIPRRTSAERPYLFTSRGCPFKCSFCSSTAFWQRVRFHSPERVAEEVEQIVDGGANQVNFQDDLATADRKRFRRIVELLEERGLAKSVGYAFSVRANLVDDALCAMMGRLKIDSVCFGAESGSDRILAMANKRLTASTNQRALDVLHAHGITCTVSAIVGWPTETEEEVRATYEFIRSNVQAGKLSPGSVVNVLSPMPGSRIWDEWMAREKVNIREFDWNRLGLYANWRHSRLGSFDAWREARKQANTVYLGTLPYERLMSILAEHEGGSQAKPQRVKFPESKIAHRYLDGIADGYEIGASHHNSFGIPCINVDRTREMDVFRQKELELAGELAKIDVVAEADYLPFADESMGFCINAHVIEHIPNPVKALLEWDRTLRVGGYIYMVIPHRWALESDKGRPVSDLSCVVNDYLTNRTESHADAGPTYGHQHVWTPDAFRKVLDWTMANTGVQWELMPETGHTCDKVANGHIAIVKKIGIRVKEC